jgi:cytoskeletal protein RodZ
MVAVRPPFEVSVKASRARTSTTPDVQAFGELPAGTDPSKFQSRRWSTPAVAGAIVLLIAVVGVPWGWYARSKARQPVTMPDKVAENPIVAPAPSTSEAVPSPTTETNSTEYSTTADTQAAKRLAEARAKERERARSDQATNSQPATQVAPKTQKTNGKNVTVTVTYDENGRVTGASGGDATALRIARQKRFPAGKPGSATVTIPIN